MDGKLSNSLAEELNTIVDDNKQLVCNHPNTIGAGCGGHYTRYCTNCRSVLLFMDRDTIDKTLTSGVIYDR